MKRILSSIVVAILLTLPVSAFCVELNNFVELRNSHELNNKFELSNAESVGISQVVIDLLEATNTNSTGRTVWGLPSDGVIADGNSLLTVPALLPAITGGRLDGSTWYDTDADGASLTNSLSVANAGTNVILQSRDPDNVVWTQRGTFAATQNLTGADGVANSGWTFSGLDLSIVGDIFQGTPGLTTATRYEPSFVLKQISAVGIIAIVAPQGPSFGDWDIDISLLSTSWELVDRNHAAVTINTEYQTAGGTATGFLFKKKAGTGTLSVGYFNSQIELGEISTPQIYTVAATVTRDADINTTSTPVFFDGTWALEVVTNPNDTGQTGTVFASYTDANNYVAVTTTATTVILRKRVAGTNYDATFTYTHVSGTSARIQAYGDATGTGIRAADTSADITAETFQTNADATDTVWAATIGWGHLNGGTLFIQAVANTEDPVAYDRKVVAGW